MSDNGQQGLWDFALRLYGKPGVSDACLVLQDRSGVDVPVLLFAAWLEHRSIVLNHTELVRIDGLVADWRNEVVKPLRAVRRRLKSGPYPAPSDESGTLRNGVKSIELGSEKIELAVLEAQAEELVSMSEPRPVGAVGNLALVLRYYRGSEPDAKAAQALALVEKALSSI